MKTIMFVAPGELLVTKGGVHRVTSGLMKALEQKGYRCIYLATSLDCRKYYSDNKEDEAHRIQDEELRNFILRNKVDIIINQSAFSSNYFSDLFQKLNLPNIKYITVFHNTVRYNGLIFNKQRMLYECRHSTTFKRRVLNGLKCALFPLWKKYNFWQTGKFIRKNYNPSDRCVFLSANEFPYLEKFLGHKVDEKCVAIHNPLSFDKIEGVECLKGKKKKVLIVSRLNNFEKRLDIALKIWRKVEDAGFDEWSLYIVGWGLQEQMLHNLAKELKLKNVHFEGRQPSEPYYRDAAVFMMTSAVEGWGLTLTESMQTGVVPMAFDSYPALSDIITDGYDGVIVPEGDIDGYASRLIELLKDKEKREALARNGLESCKRFEMEKIIKDWVSMIESL